MQLLPGAVIGMQDCKVNTFRDLDDAVAAGRSPDALVAVFGNTVNTVAQISSSDIFFPAGVRPHSIHLCFRVRMCIRKLFLATRL
jgi:hypothetical protein